MTTFPRPRTLNSFEAGTSTCTGLSLKFSKIAFYENFHLDTQVTLSCTYFNNFKLLHLAYWAWGSTMSKESCGQMRQAKETSFTTSLQYLKFIIYLQYSIITWSFRSCWFSQFAGCVPQINGSSLMEFGARYQKVWSSILNKDLEWFPLSHADA